MDCFVMFIRYIFEKQQLTVVIDMSFNTKKNVWVIFNPRSKHKTVSDSLPQFY